MQIMVSMGSDRRHRYYRIEDVVGFELEVGRRLEGVGMPTKRFDHYLGQLPSHSAKVNGHLDYPEMSKIARRHGKEISEKEYEGLFRSGDWYTKPSLTTAFSQALHQKGVDPRCDRTYTVMMKIDPSQIAFCV